MGLTVNLEVKEYKKKVVDYMLDEFKKGNTPNPDIMCNQEIKFKLFYEKAMERGPYRALVLNTRMPSPSTT